MRMFVCTCAAGCVLESNLAYCEVPSYLRTQVLTKQLCVRVEWGGERGQNYVDNVNFIATMYEYTNETKQEKE